MCYPYFMRMLLYVVLSAILATNISEAIPAFLAPRSEKKWARFASALMLCIICMFPIVPEFALTYIVSFMLFAAYMLIFYKDKLEKIAAFSVIFFSVIGSWSFMIVSWSETILRNSTPFWLYAIAACLLIIFAFLYFSIFRSYASMVSSSMVLESFTRRMWGYSTIIALTPSILVLSAVANPPKNNLALSFIAFFALFASTMVFPLIHQMGRSAKLSEENSRLKARTEYYQDIEMQQEQFRKLKHDLMNHFTVIATYLDLGENEKAVEYLKELGTKFSQMTQQYTKSTLINAILNAKAQKASSRNLELKIKADVSSDITVDETELCTLIANSIDNAIEANPPDGKIIVEIADDGTTLFYSISNRYANEIKRKKDGSFITSKDDSRNHGFGLRNINEAVVKLGGTIKITTENDIFRIYAEIPLRKEG